MYHKLKSHGNRFPLKSCGNDVDSVIPAGNAATKVATSVDIQLFWTLQ